MKVVTRDRAARELEAIYAYIARDNPRAANRVIRGLRERIQRIAETDFPEIGRQGRLPGTRELVHPPYIIVYYVERTMNRLTILSVRHGARRR